MNASVHTGSAWQHVLRAPWQQRRNQGSMWFWAVVVALASLGLLVTAAFMPLMKVAFMAAGLLAFFVFGLWIWLVASLIAQNHPHAARLVPGHVRTLRRVMTGAGVLIAGAAGVVGAAFGYGPPTLGTAVLALLATAWIVRIPLLGFFGWFIPVTQSLWSASLAAQAVGRAIEGVARAEPSLFAAGIAGVLVAASIGSLHTLLQDGDARHRRSYEARAKRQLVKRGADQASWMTAGRPGWMLGELSALPYRWRFARTCAQRSGGVLGRSLIGLGPRFHWSGQLGQALVVGVLGAAFFTLAWMAFGPKKPAGFSVTWPIATGVLSFVVLGSLAARSAFYASRREQALLMLLPGMPRGVTLNRQLALRLLLQFVCTWVVGLFVCATLVPVQTPPFGWIVMLAAACLPLAALLWRDWSRLRGTTPLTNTGPVLFVMIVCAAVVGLQTWLEISVWPFALAFVAVAIALLAWRWPAAVNAPSAFPAGRRS